MAAQTAAYVATCGIVGAQARIAASLPAHFAAYVAAPGTADAPVQGTAQIEEGVPADAPPQLAFHVKPDEVPFTSASPDWVRLPTRDGFLYPR